MIRVSGHFGEWIQGRLDASGPVALLTLTCPAFAVTVERIDADAFAVDQTPEILSPQQIARFVQLLGLVPTGRFRLQANMPLGGGAGSSTAALVALARAMGHTDDSHLVAACIEVEGASDPLMCPQPDAALWASRRGRSLRAMTPPPLCEIVGGFWGPPHRTDPADDRFADIADLVEDWQKAQGRLPRLARIASLSAMRCTALRGPGADPMADLVRDTGALGYVRAHTGSARGLIFAPGAVPRNAQSALREAGMQGVLRFTTGRAT